MLIVKQHIAFYEMKKNKKVIKENILHYKWRYLLHETPISLIYIKVRALLVSICAKSWLIMHKVI